MRSTRMACLLGMTACLLACGDDDDAPADPCGDGQLVEVGGARFCAFREGLVIEGGFRCPADFPYRIDVEGAAVCAEEPIDPSELPEEVCVRIERSCEGPPDAMPPRDTGTGDAGDAGDAGPMDAGPTDAGPDATTDGGGAGTYWTLQPAVTDFFVQAERCSYGEGRTPVVRATIHWFSSCDEPGPIEVAVNDADQTIRMSAWVWRQEGRSDCMPTGAAVYRDVQLPALRTGEWTINGTLPLRVEGPPPPITCTMPGPDGTVCLADCDCLDGGRCIAVRGDAVCESRCAHTCTRAFASPVADLACAGGGVCEDDPNLGQICEGRTLDACGASTPCPAGMRCESDADFASYCTWSVALGAAPRHACTNDAECDAGMSCVEGTDGVRTCELRCTSETMPCPGPGAHACLAQGAREGARWICEWLGE